MIGDSTFTKYSHSSLPLQMFLYFSYHYTPFFFFINLALFTYKGKRHRHVFTFKISFNSYFEYFMQLWGITILEDCWVGSLRPYFYSYSLTAFGSCWVSWSTLLPFFWQFVITFRLSISASKGNKTSTIPPLVSSLILALPMIVLHAYYISLQTYM